MTAGRVLRVVVFAPHFAEYALRLAGALTAFAEVMIVLERRNFQAECDGLRLAPDVARLRTVTYACDLTLRRMSLRGGLESRKVRRAISAFRPDVIHVQEQGDQFTAGIAETFARSCPIVATVHDPVPHSGSDSQVARRFAAGLARIRTVASGYHVHGTYCETALRERLRTAKPIANTSHGVILVPSPDLGQTGGDRHLFFGRMEAYKGLDVLLDAIDLLADRGASRFVLAGRGPELERHRDRIAKTPAIDVIDRFLPPERAIAEFQRARVVLVPYKDATQSGVVSAAMGNGRPVIASRIGGLADAVVDGENGLLVPPRDPAALAAAITRLADDPCHRRLSEGARAAALGRFAWPAVAARLEQLYRDVVAMR